MRLYPTEDVHVYVEYPNAWERYCRYPKCKEWIYGKSIPKYYMNYWGDIPGSKKHVLEFTLQDLWVPSIGFSRIRENACLPMLYNMGERYIKLEQAPPNGFKCAPLPMNLVEARVVKERLKAEKKAEKAAKKAAKKAKKEAKKAAKKQAAAKAKKRGATK